jgi:hypothetical protein
MLKKHLREPATPPKLFVERRRDVLTRAVVSGLQQLNAHMEQLPEGPEKAAALAAVACFAMRIADALHEVNAEAGGTGRS